MKLINLTKQVVTTYEIEVEAGRGKSEFYTRHGVNEPYWTYFVSYDIIGEEYQCDDELSEKLEAIFQEYKDCIE